MMFGPYCVKCVSYVLIGMMIHTSSSIQNDKSLNGKHLRVIGLEYSVAFFVKRNTSGHVVQYGGVLSLHLAALSSMFNFSYSYLPETVFNTEDSPNRRGGISYLVHDESDYLLSTTVPNPQRNKYVDFPAHWINGPIRFIIPYPKENFDFEASLKPFSFQVWIWIIVSTLTITIYLRFSWSMDFLQQLYSVQNNAETSKVAYFVFGNLISQGQNLDLTRLTSIRIAAGAWCGTCFFLVQMYCSTLTSHLTYPNQKPIVNSIHELAHTPDIDFVTEKAVGIDNMLKGVVVGELKLLADKINRSPELRCNVTADCLKLVRKGHAVYAAGMAPLQLIIGEDLKRNGACSYYLMKDILLSTTAFSVLQKNSPYREKISVGTLRITEAGLVDRWESLFIPSTERCSEINHSLEKTPRLSLGHLSSAFIILIIGYLCSTMIIIVEKITHCFFKRMHRV